MKQKSCDRCHRRKEQCVGNPCERCKQDGVHCESVRISKKMGRPKGPERYFTRRKYSRKGCITCRAQKKKCDEGLPACGRCIKGNRTCCYGTQTVDLTIETPIDLVDMETENHGINQTNSIGEIIIENDNAQECPIFSTNEVLSPIIERGTMTPSTFFNAIEQLFFECLRKKPHGSEVSSLHSSPIDFSRDEYSEQKTNLLNLCMINSPGIPNKETELLCYFINDVSMLLFTDKTTPRFLATVIPLCLVDERVRYPILAIASSHRRNNTHISDHEVVRDALRFRAKAQFCFAGKNEGFYDDSENVLLSICLVAIQEIFEGNSLYWNSALEKGAEIIRLRGGLKKVSKLSPLSIQLFCYLDHISSLSTCITPYVDRTKNNPYQDYSGNQIEDILNCKFGFRFGMAGELFKIMGNISTLASLRKDRFKSPEHGKQFDDLANMIEMALQNWSPLLLDVRDNFLLDGNLDSGQATISSYLLAVQWASFLRLHQITVGYDRKHSRVLGCLAILLESLKSLAEDTKIETGLMFPLIMAGLVCVEKHDRDYILSRVRAIKQRLRFNYIGEFEQLLLAVWAQDSDAGDLVNWALIRYYQFPGLVMF